MPRPRSRTSILALALACLAIAGAAIAMASTSPTAQRCFGAASMDRAKPCRNPQLSRQVVPSPSFAASRPNSPCTRIEREGLIYPCAFGLSPEEGPTQTVALIGDSHASHWRAAIAVVAANRRWRGLTIARTSCPFSRATKLLREPARSQCVRWNREVIAWLTRHPEIKTVFVAQVAGETGVVANGRSQFDARVDGYVRAWKALPASVERIVVIRDTPRMLATTRRCTERAIAARRRAGAACAVPRWLALRTDPAAVAASRIGHRRVQKVDLTRYMCDARVCFPVIGGALVFKDTHHLTSVYARSLGPFLLQAFERLEARG